MSYLYFPFIAQGLIMGVDEYLHHGRRLGLWERIGHPIDTITVLVPLSVIAFNPYSQNLLYAFILMSVFSCLFITKDEFIHSKECSALENWLHSILFILHPMIFLCSGLLWKYKPEDKFLFYQVALIGMFIVYQIFRWSIPWKKKK